MLPRILLGIGTATLIVLGGLFVRPSEPDSDLIRLSVRATVYAMPTSPPQIVEVTRVVEVTRIVEIVATPVATDTPQPTPTVIPEIPTTTATAETEASSTDSVALAQESAEALVSSAALEVVAASPVIAVDFFEQCPTTTNNTYSLIPIVGDSIEHPDAQHADLNLSMRGFQAVDSLAALVAINGPVDSDPPQLWTVLPDIDGPQLVQSYAVNEWNWGCGEHGCQGGGPVAMEASLIGLQTSPGQRISIPYRRPEVYGGGFVAVVLYAEPTRLTIGYTREDSVANGYSVHLENFCVDPALLEAYRAANLAGRHSLPAVHNSDTVGVASADSVLVAVRDRGAFTDPRSRKDWWQ